MNLVLDIGGMSSKIALFKEKEMVDKIQVKYEKEIDVNQLIDLIIPVMDQYLQENEIKKICIASPGTIDVQTGQMTGLSAIKDLNQVNLKKYFAKKYQKPVFVENDANCAGIAEFYLGNAKDYPNVSILVIGTGIGGVLFLNQKLIKGKTLFAGDYGYMIDHFLNSENEVQNFSQMGGMGALERYYFQITNQRKSGKEIFSEYEQDANAKTAVEKMVLQVAKGIVNIAITVNPDVFLIGGGVSENQLFLNLLQEKTNFLEKKTFTNLGILIKPCQFFNDANLIGANLLVN